MRLKSPLVDLSAKFIANRSILQAILGKRERSVASKAIAHKFVEALLDDERFERMRRIARS